MTAQETHRLGEYARGAARAAKRETRPGWAAAYGKESAHYGRQILRSAGSRDVGVCIACLDLARGRS